MMGRQRRDQATLFYEFRLDDRIPKNHLLRRIDVFVTAALADLHKELELYYSAIGRPSVDPELMIRMLIVGYCYGIRSERRLTQEVELHLAYRWFCRLDLEDEIPHHSTFSANRLGASARATFCATSSSALSGRRWQWASSRVRASQSTRACSKPTPAATTGRHRRIWSGPRSSGRPAPSPRYLAALDETAEPNPERRVPKVISPSDPSSAWTAKANKRVQFGYGLNYLIDIENAVIIDVEATPARTYDEVAATKTMIDRTERCLALRPKRLAADTAYGTVSSSAGSSTTKGSRRTSRSGRRASSGRHLRAGGLHLGQAAWPRHLSQREAAAHQRHGA